MKLTDGQSNLLLSNQAHALDGVIFPDCLIHLRFEIFSCTLLTSNHVNFLVQFGINKHLQIFQRPQIALSLRARAISLVLEKFTRAYLFQIALEHKGLCGRKNFAKSTAFYNACELICHTWVFIGRNAFWIKRNILKIDCSLLSFSSKPQMKRYHALETWEKSVLHVQHAYSWLIKLRVLIL